MFFSLLKGVTISLFAVVGAFATAGQMEQVSDYGTNPTGVQMWVYRPSGLVAHPALIVAIHACHGTAQDYFAGTQYATLSDQLKSFMVIYPSAPGSDGCWDVASNGTLRHNGGGDSIAIASQVKYAIHNYGVKASRVYMTGTSSGAMMTNVLAGAYPDVFAAGSAFAGVPYGCFAGADSWNTACANGEITKTAQEWGDLVRSGYPGYRGSYPRLQIWQGTEDTILNYHNFAEGVKQWTNIFGYPATGFAQQDSPISGYTRTTYGPKFQAIIAQGVDHNIPTQPNDVLTWFGLH